MGFDTRFVDGDTCSAANGHKCVPELRALIETNGIRQPSVKTRPELDDGLPNCLGRNVRKETGVAEMSVAVDDV